MSSPRAMSPPTSAAEKPIELSTDRMVEEFRILVAGHTGSGKSSLIDAIFKTSLNDDVIRGKAGTIHTYQEIVSPLNNRLIVHYYDDWGSEGFEKFVTELGISKKKRAAAVGPKPHVIWLCVDLPSSDESEVILDESIFKPSRRPGRVNIAQSLLQLKATVPIIVVFTKMDFFKTRLGEESVGNGLRLANGEFYEKCRRAFDALTKNKIPYALVSTWEPGTLQHLVEMTMQAMDTGAQSQPKKLPRPRNRSIFDDDQRARSGGDTLDSAQIALAAAQHVDMQVKVTASTKVGEKTMTSDKNLLNLTLEDRIRAIHNDIVAIWNIHDLDEILLDDSFRCRMISVVEVLYHQCQVNNISTKVGQSSETIAAEVGGTWTKVLRQGWSKHICCSMAYIVDLVLILQAVSQISPEDQFQGNETQDRINEIIYEFVCSGKKQSIHDAIIAFVEDQQGEQQSLASDDLENKIESLIKKNEIKKDEMQLSLERPPLPSLLAILKIELLTRDTVKQITLDLMTKLLDPSDYLTQIASGLKSDLDIELLLGFVLCLLRNDSLENCCIQDAKRKARKLMSNLSRNDVLPRTLFINNVKTNHDKIDEGGFGKVFQGEYNGRMVALKTLYKPRHDGDSLRKDFCREALAWWSLSHQSILPLLGIYEAKSELFLVSPYMTNGTLIEWRRKKWPGVIEIYRLMLEIAQGVHYIHSEGIVHGDLSGANILLDSELRCKITDFGLSRHVEATVTRTVAAHAINYTAPELFGMCKKCLRLNCIGCNERNATKTMEADVFAVGCLYYALFFGIAPFENETQFRIMWLVANGICPKRLDDPWMSDNIWCLIEHCLLKNPSERPKMRQIVEIHLARPILTNLIAELMESSLGGSMVNWETLDLMCQVSDLSDDIIAFELKSASNVELLLDFILEVLELRGGNPTHSALQDAGRKARILMSKLISAMNVVPSSLGITDVEVDLDAVTMGGFGYGFYRGNEVKVQRLFKGVQKETGKDLLLKDSRKLREVLIHRSLSHRFILPLLGIYEENSCLFVVTPFMANGTLAQWRRSLTQLSPTFEVAIHRVMLEVAQGVQYIHSEGVVHGNLHGGNILLDSSLHCKITGFVSSEHSDASVTPSASTMLTNFAAPELFDDIDEDLDLQKRMRIDVYAFGCLYFEAFFDTVPFHGKNNFQIMRFVKTGGRPDRFEEPRMDDRTWNLIQSCWESDPSKRPTLDEMVGIMIGTT